MAIVDDIIEAQVSGKIDLNVTDGSEVAKMFDCSPGTVTFAKKKLGIVKKVTWKRLLDAHHEGKVDLVNWPYPKIMKTFGCSAHTVKTAIHNGKIQHIAVRGPGCGKVDSLTKRDAQAARHYWWRFRKNYGIVNKWGVIPERVGLTKNEWRKRCASN